VLRDRRGQDAAMNIVAQKYFRGQLSSTPADPSPAPLIDRSSGTVLQG
jgi:hypothetical protein